MAISVPQTCRVCTKIIIIHELIHEPPEIAEPFSHIKSARVLSVLWQEIRGFIIKSKYLEIVWP